MFSHTPVCDLTNCLIMFAGKPLWCVRRLFSYFLFFYYQTFRYLLANYQLSNTLRAFHSINLYPLVCLPQPIHSDLSFTLGYKSTRSPIIQTNSRNLVKTDKEIPIPNTCVYTRYALTVPVIYLNVLNNKTKQVKLHPSSAKI